MTFPNKYTVAYTLQKTLYIKTKFSLKKLANFVVFFARKKKP